MKDSVLTSARLLDGELPSECAAVLDGLAELDVLRRSREPRAARAAAARAVYEQLMRDAAALAEPVPAELDRRSAEYKTWFTEAVLLWIRLAGTSSPPLVDTVGTRTLRDFPLDLPDADIGAAELREAVGRVFAWAPGELGRVERTIDHLTSNLPLKRELTRTLAAELAGPGALEPARRVALLRAFYGPLPFRPGDVDVIVTSTSIFFCLPIEGDALAVEGYGARPLEERAAITATLRAIDAANTAETKRFPAFGLFEANQVDEALLERLARASGVRVEVVRATLATMVSILTTRLADQYLVHDAWGHTWQEALTEFEWEFELLERLDHPLGPDDGPAFGGAAAPRLADAFAGTTATELDEATLRRFAEADLRGRLRVAASAALAEMLADVMEAKYARTGPQHDLPTSSLLLPTSLKLDLTIGDVRRQIRRAGAAYLAFASDAAARQDLVMGLRALGRPERGLLEAIEAAADRLRAWFGDRFDDGLAPEPLAEGGLRSTLLRRIVLQFVLVASEIERRLERVSHRRTPPWTDPASCTDLFVIAVARFYEQDRQRNFWHIDQVVRTEFDPTCQALRAAMEKPGAG